MGSEVESIIQAMGSEVESIQVRLVEVPLAQQYRLAYAVLERKTFVVVKLIARDGTIGWGEAAPLPPLTDESVQTVLEVIRVYLSPVILGQSALDVNRLNSDMDKAIPGHLMAKGALDMALWDLVGHSLNQPIHRLLGGALHHRFPLHWPIGSVSVQETVQTMVEKSKLGFKTFMIKVAPDPLTNQVDLKMQIQRIHAIRRQFQFPEFRLNMDANQCLNLGQALRLAEELSKLDVDFLEQPLPRAQDSWALPRLKAACPGLALSADESVRSLDDVAALASAHAYDVFSIKVSKNGGISRARDMMAVAKAHGVAVLANSMVELGLSQAAGLQLAATCPNLVPGGQCFMSTLRMACDITNFSDYIKNGEVEVPGKPGLGVDVREDRLDELTIHVEQFSC
ncbi:unnamed protein product [Effrenium voratum]|nr:unnamed protein product [Effrenium voratum]